jgi:hypothetical protein
MQDDVIKVARLICNQMQDDDCTCTSACGASIYAARAAMAATREIDAEAIRWQAKCLREAGDQYSDNANGRDWCAEWLQQRAQGAKP